MEHRTVVPPLRRVPVTGPAFADLTHFHTLEDVGVGAGGIVAGGVGGVGGVEGLGGVVDIWHCGWLMMRAECQMNKSLSLLKGRLQEDDGGMISPLRTVGKGFLLSPAAGVFILVVIFLRGSWAR